MVTEEKFINLLKDSEPIVIVGLARLLGINILEDNEPKDGLDLLIEIVEKFNGLRRSRKKEIYKLVKKANKVKEPSIYADRT